MVYVYVFLAGLVVGAVGAIAVWKHRQELKDKAKLAIVKSIEKA